MKRREDADGRSRFGGHLQFGETRCILINGFLGSFHKTVRFRVKIMTKDSFRFTSVKTLVFLYFLVALSTGMIIYSAVMVHTITYNQSVNYNNHFRYHIANDCFRQGTDLLTEAVRRYVVTMKPEYIESYFSEALEKRHGVKADKRKIDIGEPIRETGIRTISVWLYSGVTTPMKLDVQPIKK